MRKNLNIRKCIKIISILFIHFSIAFVHLRVRVRVLFFLILNFNKDYIK